MSEKDFECLAKTGVKSPLKAKWPLLAGDLAVRSRFQKCAETVPLGSNSYTLNSLFSVVLTSASVRAWFGASR